MIGILQLSDIHFRESTNPVLDRLRQIKGAVQGEGDLSELLLIISGDVANWGKPKEYSIAVNFVSDLEQLLAGIKGVKFLGTVAIPGNHDLDFDLEGTVRPLLLSNPDELVEKVEGDGDLLDQMVRVQEHFFEFEALIERKPHPGKDRLFWNREFASEAGKILVRCFNTAWISRKKEIPGQILFPVQAIPQLDGSDHILVVSTFHHPYGWLNPENARAFKRVIETSSDLVLTGHEHDGDAYTKITTTGDIINYIEAAPLQAAGVSSGFNLIKIDLQAQTYQARQFEWAKDMYVAGTTAARMFARNQALLEHHFVNEPSFKEFLNDVGAPFTHPARAKLTLSDLFVYPDLGIETIAGKKSKEAVVLSANVLEYVAAKPFLSIAGAPTSGKTALAKTLYTDLQQKNRLVPLLLQAGDIRGVNESQVQAAIDRAFDKQYPKRLLERFNQLDPESKVVIFDDWHKVKFIAKGKKLILDALTKRFGHVVLFTDDASMLNQLTEALAAGEVPNVEYCEIKQFGYRARGELVGKWEMLGREFEVEEMELTHRISESENLLDTLVGKGIVPAFPFFIFFVLQSENATDHNATYGSYGHIYQALLTTRMARFNPKHLGMKFVFLSLLAFEMFQRNQRALTHAQAAAVHKKYEREYSMSVSLEELMEDLIEGQVLIAEGDAVEFKYRYGYFYFVAQYFHDGIANVKEADVLRQKLTTIADNAYTDDNAHVLTFYLYMSKDRMLMEHILENAKGLFASDGVSDMDQDVAFATPLYNVQPRLQAPSEDTDENRRQRRIQRDTAAVPKDDADDVADASEDRDLDFAVQSINIMGQVLRNFATDLRADLKLSLTQESYHLGLRMMRHFLRLLEHSEEAFRRDMLRYFRMLQPFSRKSEEQLRSAVDRTFLSFVELVLFGSVKRISESVGVQELRDTYEAVRSAEGEAHVPTRMIDLAIKLEHFAYIPEQDVEDLKRRLQGNPAVYTTLRMLVAEFLHLFPVENRIRQRMEKVLDFQPGAPLISRGKKVKKLSTSAKTP